MLVVLDSSGLGMALQFSCTSGQHLEPAELPECDTSSSGCVPSPRHRWFCTAGFAQLAAHVSCACVTHAAAATWNLPGLACLAQGRLCELLSPSQGDTSVRLLYCRLIQEELNSLFPLLVNATGSSEAENQNKLKNSKEVLSE